MTFAKQSRRRFLKGAAATGAAVLAMPYVKTAHSAGKVSLGLWDHWVPGANDVMTQVVQEWAKKNNVEATIDYITSIGSKNRLTAQAEARAKTGHDIFAFPTWDVTIHKDSLEPVDDVVEEIIKKYGDYTVAGPYLGKHDGVWKGIPAPTGSHTYGMVSRIDLFKQHAGVDIQELFPAGPRKDPTVPEWNYDNFLVYAEKLFNAGFPFGNPIGPTSDSQDWTGPLFLSFGAKMVDEEGNITVDSPETRQAIEYMIKLTKFMPPDVYAWDDAGNNRWIVSGRGSCVQNPPSAWTVAKRDAKEIAAQMWHHDTPRGPKGHFRGSLPYLWGIWSFSPNKSAAKDLLLHMSQKEQVGKLITASQGYDMPLLPSFYDHPVWETEGPPPGGIYNYPIRGDEVEIVAGYPAPPAVAAQIYTQAIIPTMVARVTQAGEKMDDAIKWAENELEGYLRG